MESNDPNAKLQKKVHVLYTNKISLLSRIHPKPQQNHCHTHSQLKLHTDSFNIEKAKKTKREGDTDERRKRCDGGRHEQAEK
jgi:hypothetical protein